MQMISVLIATKDRSSSLFNCLKSILKNKNIDFEILVLDQSHNLSTKLIVEKLNSNKIRYFKLKAKGKSYALNLGISKARGDLLSFTDDDCIVSINWLDCIQETFNMYPEAAMVFGKSVPYKSKSHKYEICPAVFSLDSEHSILEPTYHALSIGFGNNMSFQKKIIQKHFRFKNWLGPGSVGQAAEDAEIALQCLLSKNIIRYNSKILVSHNKWLTEKENHSQGLSYLCGETACYGYFLFQGYDFARDIVLNNFKDSLTNFVGLFKNLLKIKFNKFLPFEFKLAFLEFSFRLIGLFIGLIFSIIEPIKK